MTSHNKKELTPEEKAYNKVLRLVSVREHSTQSLRERLQKDAYEEAVIEEVIAKAERLYLVDDRRYCEALVRTRLASGKGLEPTKREIEALGVDIESLESYQDYLADQDETDYDRALALLERKPPRSKNLRDGAFRKLISNGFSSSLASAVASEWARSHDDRYRY